MTSTTLVPSALLAIAALLAGSGCSTEYKGSYKADFVAKANAICEVSGATLLTEGDPYLEAYGDARAYGLNACAR